MASEAQLAEEGEVDVEVEVDFDEDLPAAGQPLAAAQPLEELDFDALEAAPPPAREPEADDDGVVGGLPGVRHEVAVSDWDCTPNVFCSAAGVLSAMCQGPFLHLLSSARANTGAKAGRYFFEVAVLEKVLQAQPELRIGFSIAGSSLLVGDSPDSIGFAKDGTYFVAEPAQLTSMQRPGACEPFLERGTVIGLLLNLDAASKVGHSVSIFIDGRRAGSPQPLPSHLKGRALYPTITFRGLTLAVSFGRGGVPERRLPFVCRTFAQIAAAHHEKLPAPHGAVPAGELRVVMPVGLPEADMADFVRRFKEQHPHFLEFGDRPFAAWCRASGKPKLVGQAAAALDVLVSMAQASRRCCLLTSVGQNLQEPERRRLLSKFSPAYTKVAVVAVGRPSDEHKQWVCKTLTQDFEAEAGLYERRRLLAEASGVYWDEESDVPPARPALDVAVLRLRRASDEPPDVAPEALAKHFASYSLPSAAEGFDELRFEWAAEAEAQELLRRWIVRTKSSVLLESLEPGEWFRAKLAAWRKDRQALREQHVTFNQTVGPENEAIELDAAVDTAHVHETENIHDCDGYGTPIYGRFRYEDWVLLSLRYELHLLVHGFVSDVADPDVQGLNVEHLSQYFQTYFGVKVDVPQKLGVASLADAMRLLEGALELKEFDDTMHFLRTPLEKESTFEVFVKGVEAFRRERRRRLQAGDESAQLSFPKAGAAGSSKGVPFKAAPSERVASKAAPSAPVKAAPAAARVAQTSGVGGSITGASVPAKAAPPAAGLAIPAKAAPKLAGDMLGAPPTKRARAAPDPAVSTFKARPHIAKMRPVPAV